MAEFRFRITTKDGIKLTYSLQANEKLDAFAAVNSRFPDSRVELISTITDGIIDNEPPKEEKMIELLNKLYKDELIWFMLGSLISADNLISEDKYAMNLGILLDMEKVLDKTNISKEDKIKISEYVQSSIDLVSSEYKKIYGKDLQPI